MGQLDKFALAAIGQGAAHDAAALSLLAGSEGAFTLSVLDASPDCIKLVELDGSLSFMNHNGLCAMEIDDFAMVDGQPWPMLWPEAAQAQLHEAVQQAGLGTASEFEAYCPTAKGTPKYWHVSVAPVRDGQGRVMRLLAASRDITDRVLREREVSAHAARLETELEQKRALLAEIDHRVKNSFALISGLLRMQMRDLSSPEAKGALQDAASRIATLARVHDQLHFNPETRVVPLAPYLQSLVSDLGESLGQDEQVVPGDLAEADMPAEAAIAVGLVAAELLGNALRHGGGVVSLDLRRDGDDLLLRVEDEGSGLPEGFELETAGGLGMRMARVYASQLGGDLSCEAGTSGKGACFILRFPLPGAGQPG